MSTQPQHPSNSLDLDGIDNLFDYHAPDELTRLKYLDLRSAAKLMARSILATCPPCADRTAAIRKVREALMTANAAIALEPPLQSKSEG